MNDQTTIETRIESFLTDSKTNAKLVMEIVDSLDTKHLQLFDSFHPKNLRHYAETQRKWLQDSEYFLGIDLGYSPSASEIASKILQSTHSQRFRAFYTLSFPQLVTLDDDAMKLNQDRNRRLYIDR